MFLALSKCFRKFFEGQLPGFLPGCGPGMIHKRWRIRNAINCITPLWAKLLSHLSDGAATCDLCHKTCFETPFRESRSFRSCLGCGKASRNVSVSRR